MSPDLPKIRDVTLWGYLWSGTRHLFSHFFFFFTAIDFSIGDARNVVVHDSLSSLPFLRSSMYLISNTNLKSAL